LSPEEKIEQAYHLLQSGKTPEAESIARELVEKHKGLDQAHFLLARILPAKGEVIEALAEADKALELQPENPEYLNLRGQLLASMGRFGGARASYEKALDVAPNYLNAAMGMGNLELLNSNPTKAVSIFEQAYAHHQGHPHILQGLINALIASAQYDKALSVLPQLGQNPAMAFTAGRVFLGVGQRDQALSAFQQALAVPETTGPALKQFINIIRMDVDDEKATQTLQQILTQNPQHQSLQWEAAGIFLELGRADLAFAALDNQDKLVGAHPFTDFMRASLLTETGEGEKAFPLIEKVMQSKAASPAMLRTFANAALMAGKPEAALKAAQTALPRNPSDQYWIAIFANALRALGKDYQSILDYEALVRVYDIDAPAEYDSLPEFMSALNEALDQLHSRNYRPIGQSAKDGTQTSFDLRFAPNRVIQDFFQSMEYPIMDYLKAVGQDQDHPLLRHNKGGYRLSEAWSVRQMGGGAHKNHLHNNSWLSATFFVDVPKKVSSEKTKKGWLKFGEPPFTAPGLEAEHFVAPKIGRLVLFPSYMWHGTVEFPKNQSRLSLSFNILPG